MFLSQGTLKVHVVVFRMAIISVLPDLQFRVNLCTLVLICLRVKTYPSFKAQLDFAHD